MADARRVSLFALSLRGLHRMVLVLLTALVLVQTVGVLHRVVHAHSTHPVVVAAEAPLAPVTLDLMGGLQRLWGDHSNAVDCQLFEQSCPDAWHTPAVVLMPVLPAPGWLVAMWQARFAVLARFYAARGPPVWH